MDVILPAYFVIFGKPVSKKNGKKIIRTRSGRPMIISNSDVLAWERDAVRQLKRQWMHDHPIPKGILLNARIVSYCAKRQRSDASNLYEAPQDALQEAGILENDYWIVSHNGSKRLVDDENPRVEITLTEVDQ